MKKVFSVVALGLLTLSLATSCNKKEEPVGNSNGTKVEEPQKRDWLDGKTFEYIEDADKPAAERQANDFTFIFADGKLKFTFTHQDGTEAQGEYVRNEGMGTADYVYDKPHIVLSNIKMSVTETTLKDGKKTSTTEEVEPNDTFKKMKVDEEANAILLLSDEEKGEYSPIPEKK